jgi:phosphomethylpyrimidine synthase
MCGAEFCSMRIDQDARDVDGQMDDIADDTDLGASPAAEVNRPPTGAHDTSDVPPVEEVVDDTTADLLTGDD